MTDTEKIAQLRRALGRIQQFAQAAKVRTKRGRLGAEVSFEAIEKIAKKALS